MINIEYLKNMSSVKRFQKGSVIIQESDSDTACMYILLQGKVGVYKNYGQEGQVFLSILNPSDFFGEMSLFLNKERTASVVAEEDVAVLEISRMNAYDFFENQPGVTYSLIRTLCIRIDELNARMMPEPKIETEEQPATILAPDGATVASDLFPSGHSRYALAITPPSEGLLRKSSFQCPLCLHVFDKKTVRIPELRPERTDMDLRRRYKGIDPLYYEVITCPNCLLSAYSYEFERALTSHEKQLYDLISRYKDEFDFSGDVPKDINDVFTGLYLALRCAPLCFRGSTLIAAGLWLRLSWLYGDCRDEKMEEYATHQACQWHINASKRQSEVEGRLQKINLIIAELSLKLKDFDTAEEYFNKARRATMVTAVYTRQAEDRLNELNMFKPKNR